LTQVKEIVGNERKITVEAVEECQRDLSTRVADSNKLLLKDNQALKDGIEGMVKDEGRKNNELLVERLIDNAGQLKELEQKINIMNDKIRKLCQESSSENYDLEMKISDEINELRKLLVICLENINTGLEDAKRTTQIEGRKDPLRSNQTMALLEKLGDDLGEANKKIKSLEETINSKTGSMIRGINVSMSSMDNNINIINRKVNEL
jgi:uncharacterized protein YukE